MGLLSAQIDLESNICLLRQHQSFEFVGIFQTDLKEFDDDTLIGNLFYKGNENNSIHHVFK